MKVKYKDYEKAYIKSSSQYKQLYKDSMESPDIFWGQVADRIDWYQKWDKVSDVNFSKAHIKWFENAKLNISYNCLDRHVENGFGNEIALIWEGNNPNEDKKYTYNELLEEVSKFANVLKKHHIQSQYTMGVYLYC